MALQADNFALELIVNLQVGLEFFIIFTGSYLSCSLTYAAWSIPSHTDHSAVEPIGGSDKRRHLNENAA